MVLQDLPVGLQDLVVDLLLEDAHQELLLPGMSAEKKNTKEINRLEEIFWGQVLVGQETSTKKSYIFCAKSSYISNRILVILHLILFRPLLVP